MKIIILSTAYPLRGGIAHFVHLLYKELKNKHDVRIITFKRQYPSFLFPGKTQDDVEENIDNIKSEVIVDSINPINWIKVGKKIKNERPDLIIYKFWMPFFAPCFGVISRIARSNAHTKSLTICDNVIPHETRIGETALTKFFFNVVDYFITMSKKVSNDLLSIKPRAKYKLLNHPIYVNFGEPISKREARDFLKIPDTNVLIFFGFIRKYKGLDTILNALPIIKKEIDIKLLVAGEFYTDKEPYLKIIENKNLKNDVLLHTDFIPSEEVKYYFSAANATVLPYKQTTQSGISQIANNFHKPMIVTNTGGLVDDVIEGKTGYIVSSENPKELAAAVIKFFKENKEEEFVDNIKRNLDNYSWSAFAKGLETLVQDNQE